MGAYLELVWSFLSELTTDLVGRAARSVVEAERDQFFGRSRVERSLITKGAFLFSCWCSSNGAVRTEWCCEDRAAPRGQSSAAIGKIDVCCVLNVCVYCVECLCVLC
jgi:hypothetical protein